MKCNYWGQHYVGSGTKLNLVELVNRHKNVLPVKYISDITWNPVISSYPNW